MLFFLNFLFPLTFSLGLFKQALVATLKTIPGHEWDQIRKLVDNLWKIIYCSTNACYLLFGFLSLYFVHSLLVQNSGFTYFLQVSFSFLSYMLSDMFLNLFCNSGCL